MMYKMSEIGRALWWVLQSCSLPAASAPKSVKPLHQMIKPIKVDAA